MRYWVLLVYSDGLHLQVCLELLDHLELRF